MYSIQGGSKFEPVLDPAQLGIFDASKSYYLIFTRAGAEHVDRGSALAREKHAIYLWIGEDQTSLNMLKALAKMQETEFRGVPAVIEGGAVSESDSRKIVNVAPKMRRSVMPASIDQSELRAASKEEKKAGGSSNNNNVILTPIVNKKFA